MSHSTDQSKLPETVHVEEGQYSKFSSATKVAPSGEGVITSEVSHGSLSPALFEGKHIFTAPEARGRFPAPIDKLFLRFRWRPQFKLIEAYRLKEDRPPSRRFFSHKDSHRFRLPNSAMVTVFQNSYCTDLQVNPTEWYSLKSLRLFLQYFLGSSHRDATVIRIHCFVDVGIPFKDLFRSLRINRISKSSRFEPSIHYRSRSGVPEEAEFTASFGTSKRRSYVIYNSAKKHHLPEPCTRIERRDNTGQTAIIKTLGAAPRSWWKLARGKSPRSVNS